MAGLLHSLTRRFARLPLWTQTACLLAAVLAILGLGADLLRARLPGANVQPDPARVAAYRLDLAALREMTANDTGPLRINRLRVAYSSPDATRNPEVALSFEATLSFNAFQLVYSNRRQNSTVLLDTGPDERSRHPALAQARFEPEALSRVQREIDRARSIYALRADSLHLGGIARSSRAYSARDRLRLNLAQLRSPALIAARFPPAVLEAMRAIDCPERCRFEPGAVRITRGHPDTAWIYLRTADNRELLFVGNPAIHFERDIVRGQARSWVSFWRNGLDGREIMAQIFALREIYAQNSRLQIVPVHDEARIQALQLAGHLRSGFETVSPFVSANR